MPDATPPVNPSVSSPSSSASAQASIQKFGRFLSGMVMPNIGAFIAWGIIAACFIPTGWFPNATLARLVSPMITYLLPLLIGYTGGQMVHGKRGAVIGAVATMGVIVGADVPMFMGAMTVGPFAAWVLKRFDKLIEGKVPAGFEMLVNNFSLGIIGVILVLGALLVVGPFMTTVSRFLAAGVQFIVERNMLPLANVFIEPGKILFLNNAINHGILSPIAISESQVQGKSILFMLESNPGPGLGILLAYSLVGKGSAKNSAAGAAIIHFFGGIHEIYFPYVLMKPRLILAAIVGGVSATFTFSLLHTGLVAAPSPGSIFSFLALAPRGDFVSVVAGIFAATVTSFTVAVGLLRFERTVNLEGELETSRESLLKLKGSSVPLAAAVGMSARQPGPAFISRPVNKIVFACDAGMGSSAMGAAVLRKKLKEVGSLITVTNAAIDDLPTDTDLVITHQSLTERARLKLPAAEHISIQDFFRNPVYDELVQRFSHEPSAPVRPTV
ncbi:MAG TPA: PTS mannitol transporter subunit IICBA [Chthoniobacterales bacterium]